MLRVGFTTYPASRFFFFFFFFFFFYLTFKGFMSCPGIRGLLSPHVLSLNQQTINDMGNYSHERLARGRNLPRRIGGLMVGKIDVSPGTRSFDPTYSHCIALFVRHPKNEYIVSSSFL